VHIAQPHRISQRLSTSDTILFVIGCAGEFGGSDTCGEPAALVVPWDAGRRRPAALLRHPMSQQREAKDGNRIVRVQIEAQKIAIGHLMTKSRYYKEFQNYSNLSASPDSYVRALEQMLDRFSHKNDRWPVYDPIGPRERLVASLGKVTRFGGLIHEFGDAYEYGCPYTCLCALSGIRTPANPHGWEHCGRRENRALDHPLMFMRDGRVTAGWDSRMDPSTADVSRNFISTVKNSGCYATRGLRAFIFLAAPWP
jgi:hypothetical protein